MFLEIRKHINKASHVPETVQKTLHNGDSSTVKLIQPYITEEQKKIVTLIQKATPVDQLKSDFPHKRIFIYQNSIYDLTDYHHPGGSIYHTNHLWQEISRYVKGMHNDEVSNSGLHAHSIDAYKVLDSHYIGSVLPAIPTDIEDTNPLLEKGTEYPVQVDTLFELGLKTVISNNLVMVNL